ncbi:MAG: hypothetical protein NTX56_04135 [Proteobacteria bacterium]|nr:hypothetical protein [Pseudomonadota bacterium]
MKTVKHVLRPERLRQVPEQFSWVDQALVQRHYIDRCDARAAALYLFLITVADAQGLSYYGEATMARRLHLSIEELVAARGQLITLELIAYHAPLYQVLALPGTVPRAPPGAPAEPAQARERNPSDGPVRLGQLLEQMGRRRAQL